MYPHPYRGWLCKGSCGKILIASALSYYWFQIMRELTVKQHCSLSCSTSLEHPWKIQMFSRLSFLISPLCQMSGISVVGRDKYGVFPLRGKLLNVREASHKQIMENAEITNIKRILGLQHGKDYDSTKSLRYGHLMIMTDQVCIAD